MWCKWLDPCLFADSVAPLLLSRMGSQSLGNKQVLLVYCHWMDDCPCLVLCFSGQSSTAIMEMCLSAFHHSSIHSTVHGNQKNIIIRRSTSTTTEPHHLFVVVSIRSSYNNDRRRRRVLVLLPLNLFSTYITWVFLFFFCHTTHKEEEPVDWWMCMEIQEKTSKWGIGHVLLGLLEILRSSDPSIHPPHPPSDTHSAGLPHTSLFACLPVQCRRH